MSTPPATAPSPPLPVIPRLIGMVHVGALPGTPAAAASVAELAAAAADEARRLAESGFHAVMLENMHDLPYLRREVGPEIVAAMTRVAAEVRAAIPAVPLGIQILAGANRAALATAQATGGSFIRAEGFAYAAAADEGLFADADAGPLLRHRRVTGASSIAILADVRKKHSAHAITGDLALAELVHGTVFCGADAVVITGSSTGDATRPADVAEAAAASDGRPVLVGSGATPESLPALLAAGAHGVIVGTAIKRDGDWRQPVDPTRAAGFAEAFERASAG